MLECLYMDFFEKIVAWNNERGLIEKGYHHTNEVSFIVEELIESNGNIESVEAREKALSIAKEITSQETKEHEKKVDAFADIIVFATGAIAKLGYNPSKVMDEVYKEINSRTGKLIDGKFVKDPDAPRYYADFTNCKN